MSILLFLSDESLLKAVDDQRLLLSHDGLAVYDQRKFQPQTVGGLAAQQHAAQEYLEIVHNGADLRVDGQLQPDLLMLPVYGELGMGDGVVDPVVDVEGGKVLAADAAAAYVALVGKDEGGGHVVDGNAGTLVVVADGGGHKGDLLGGEAPLVQQTEGHDGAGLAVLHPVYKVSDVMEIACDLGKLHGPLGKAQRLQYPPGSLGAEAHVGKAVLGIAQSGEGGVGLGDIGSDGGIVLYILISHIYSPVTQVPVFSVSGPLAADARNTSILSYYIFP